MRKSVPQVVAVQQLDALAQNVEKLCALFPEAVVDGKADFDVLRQLLGGAADEAGERYGLSWHGKRIARQLALAPSMAALQSCPGDSVDWETTRNLFLEGDNLDALKLLQESFAGKVKLIYIDPPYNTGNDLVYRDDYSDTRRISSARIRQLDGSGARLASNAASSARLHTDWLNMIYPRLLLAKPLLREDGLLVVSISDAEIHNLRYVLDEIFGPQNLIGCVVWNSTKSVTNTALISVSHTYNLIYANDIDHFVAHRSQFRLPEDGEGFANPDNDPRGPWKADPFQVGGERPNQLYPITNPKTGEVYRPNPGCSWKNEYRVFQRLLTDNRIVFGVSGEAGPQRKRFLREALERGRVAKTLWTDIDTTTNATRQLKELMGWIVFDNPKPVELIRRFIQLGTHDPHDAIVLDFFAGSGTTGEAVMAQNAADGGTRRYILVQLPEPLSPDRKPQKAAAQFCASQGKPLTLAELTKERLRRAARKLRATKPTFEGDTGFQVYKLQTGLENNHDYEQRPDDTMEPA